MSKNELFMIYKTLIIFTVVNKNQYGNFTELLQFMKKLVWIFFERFYFPFVQPSVNIYFLYSS